MILVIAEWGILHLTSNIIRANSGRDDPSNDPCKDDEYQSLDARSFCIAKQTARTARHSFPALNLRVLSPVPFVEARKVSGPILSNDEEFTQISL